MPNALKVMTTAKAKAKFRASITPISNMTSPDRGPSTIGSRVCPPDDDSGRRSRRDDTPSERGENPRRFIFRWAKPAVDALALLTRL
jgi:hypothetical protein